MAFCNKCGNQLPDGANNCPKCGAPVGGTQQNAQGFVNNMMNTADSTAQFDPQDITANKGMSVLAYCLPAPTQDLHVSIQIRVLCFSCLV